MQTPSVGRIVHYQFGGATLAAMITAVLDGNAVNLTAFMPDASPSWVFDLDGNPAAIPYAAEPTLDHWNWPPRS